MNDSDYVLPLPRAIEHSRSKLLSLDSQGLGIERTKQHLLNDIVPGLNRSSQSPNFYGFVTGGATPAASFADRLVTEHDQSVQVHLPHDTVATFVEEAALRMLCDLFRLSANDWKHRIFTTGATASNVLGLACGREFVIQRAGKDKGIEVSVGEDGVLQATQKAGIEKVQIITTVPHSSLGKAASIVGLGRSSLVEVGAVADRHRFDFTLLEEMLREGHGRVASIVAVSCAEVNTGLFATTGDDMQRLRSLCDQYGAWLHVDAAFGLQARVLTAEESAYSVIVDGVRGLELADSITGDAHKLLNVPYDCGIFFSRHLLLATQVFRNAGAAYLSISDASEIPSPLNIGIENSRRFRALPVYATLAAYGRDGYQDILHRQIRLARAIASLIELTPGLELLPHFKSSEASKEKALDRIYIVVLFRAVDEQLNVQLVEKINATRKIFVSGTKWDDRAAARFAVSNWQVDIDRDMKLIRQVLLSVLHP